MQTLGVEPLDATRVRDRLRQLTTAGGASVMPLIRSLDVDAGHVAIVLDADGTHAASVTETIRREVSALDGVVDVRIKRALPSLDPTPRADFAPEAGYDEWGPDALPGEIIDPERYEGAMPVFQWEMDPADSTMVSGSADVVEGDWEYSVWWQTHPAKLVYVSIQALQDDSAESPGRKHPVGRNVTVNLVYDPVRDGIVSIYGTARDFRPFVLAFAKAYGPGAKRDACGVEAPRERAAR